MVTAAQVSQAASNNQINDQSLCQRIPVEYIRAARGFYAQVQQEKTRKQNFFQKLFNI
jgi:hypothetical protein